MEKERDQGEIPESEADAVTPATALEDTLEQHLGIFPGDATREGAHETAEPSEFSFWPITTAVAVLLIGVGLLSTQLVVSLVGALLLMVALVGWFTEAWVS